MRKLDHIDSFRAGSHKCIHLTVKTVTCVYFCVKISMNKNFSTRRKQIHFSNHLMKCEPIMKRYQNMSEIFALDKKDKTKEAEKLRGNDETRKE